MKPEDENGRLPASERPFRVLVISGPDRRQYDCPGVDSKSRTLMMRMADRLPAEWEIGLEDLGNVYARARIQSCNACASTSMALCVWPCNCYRKGDRAEPDLPSLARESEGSTLGAPVAGLPRRRHRLERRRGQSGGSFRMTEGRVGSQGFRTVPSSHRSGGGAGRAPARPVQRFQPPASPTRLYPHPGAP